MAQLERPTAAAEDGRPVVTTIGEIRPQDLVRITGVIRSKAALSLSGCPACRYTLADGTGEVDLLFLGRQARPNLYRLHEAPTPPVVPSTPRPGCRPRIVDRQC